MSGSRKVDLVFPCFLSDFIFFLIYFSIFLFLELRVRVKPMNTRRETWKNNVVQWVQHMLALRCAHGHLG